MKYPRTTSIFLSGILAILGLVVAFQLYQVNSYDDRADSIVPVYSTNEWKIYYGDLDNEGEVEDYQIRYPFDFEVSDGARAAGGFIGAPKVQFRFPENYFGSGTNFVEGYLTVSSGSDQTSIDNCYVNNVDETIKSDILNDARSINGVVFNYGEGIGAAAGQLYASEIYRVRFGGQCVEMILTVRTGNPDNYDPGTVQEFDKERAFIVLRQMAESFRLRIVAP